MNEITIDGGLLRYYPSGSGSEFMGTLHGDLSKFSLFRERFDCVWVQSPKPERTQKSFFWKNHIDVDQYHMYENVFLGIILYIHLTR